MMCEIIQRNEFYLENGVHPLDSMLIVLDGAFEFSFSKTKHIARKNDIVIFNKNSRFERKILSPIRCIYLKFDKFPFPLENGFLVINDAIRLASTINYFELSIKNRETQYLDHFANDIFMLYKISRTRKKSTTDSVAEECASYMTHHCGEKIELDMLAEKFCISKQGLINKFKKAYGRTPMEYLTQYRITKARKMLLDSDIPVGEIAYDCGFENTYYFSNVFKKKIGISPLKYRKKFLL